MKISYCEKPFMMEFQMLADSNKFIAEIKKTGCVYVYARFHTKTRIETSLYLPGYCFGIDQKVINIKTHYEKELNYLSGEYIEKHYFRILKDQGIIAFEKYVDAIIHDLIHDENLEIKIFETDVIKLLKNKRR